MTGLKNKWNILILVTKQKPVTNSAVIGLKMWVYSVLVIIVVGMTFMATAEVLITKPGKFQFDSTLLENATVVGSNRTGRQFYPKLVEHFREETLPFVIRELGMIECEGLDHTFGGDFFETLLGEGADFGGNHLCLPTCGGECVVTKGLEEAPISTYYPFGCRCPQTRCDAHGPIITPLNLPIFKVVCVRDDRCSCASMGEPGDHTGYLCNWINLNTHLPLSFLDKPFFPGYPPKYSPVRWCSCCPNVQLF